MELTKVVRGSSDSLFILTRKLYKTASKGTICLWIRATLNLCGIDPKYRGHSIRHEPHLRLLKGVASTLRS